MKPITINFNKGVQFPANLGTLKLRPTAEGKAAYAQNIDITNDEYGNGVAVPGPALTTIGNNSELTGVPAVRQFLGHNFNGSDKGYLYFGQSLLGTKSVIRRIKDIVSGSTPVIDTSTSGTISHSGHTNLEIVDMIYRPTGNGNYDMYVSVKDDTDCTLYSFDGLTTNMGSLALRATNGNFTSGGTNQFLVYSTFDNNLYWIGQQRVSSIDVSNTYTVAALSLGLPVNTYASCGADWQQLLVVAYTTSPFGGFDLRKFGGNAGIAVWDYISPSIIRNIPAPCRFISALINSPDGNLLVFNGLSEGKSAIYTFTGYGFRLLAEYIGDMPRSRHSIEFDAQARIVWQTVEGQLCRFDPASGVFEHLGSITTGSTSGGLLAKGIGSPIGNEFFVASGSGSTYTLKKVQFGSFVGDNQSATDTINTPLIVSGIQALPQGSNIQAITLQLAKSLEAGEKVELRIYANGSTTPTTYLTMDYTTDGPISSKREVLQLDDINSFSLGVAWKQADGLTTAPPVLYAEVEPGFDK